MRAKPGNEQPLQPARRMFGCCKIKSHTYTGSVMPLDYRTGEHESVAPVCAHCSSELCAILSACRCPVSPTQPMAHMVSSRAGAVLGRACGIASGLAYAKIGLGEATINTTGQSLPLLTGDVVYLGLSLLIAVVGSLVASRRDLDWKELNIFTKTEDTVSAHTSSLYTFHLGLHLL